MTEGIAPRLQDTRIQYRVPAMIAVGLTAGALAGVGLGGAVAVAVPALIAWGLAAVGEVRLFLAITIAISGIGFYWLEGGLDVGGQGINVSGMYWGVLLLLSTGLLLARRPARLPRPFRLYALFVALSAAGIAWAPSLFEGLRHFGLYLLPALMGAVVLAYARDTRDVRFLVGAFWVATALAIIVAIGMSVARWSAGVSGGLTSGVGERTLAIFLLPMLALALAGARHGSRWLIWVAVAIGLVGLGTLSRMAVAVMLAMAFFAGLGLRPITRLAVLALLAALGYGALQLEAFRERFGTGNASVAEVEVEGTGRHAALAAGSMNLSGRGYIWLQVGQHAIERPVLGHGTGSASFFMRDLPATHVDHPHNDYLRAFHDAGAIGLITVLAFGLGTWWYFRRLYLQARTRLAKELALASYLGTAGFGMIALTDNPAIYATFFTQNLFILFALTEIALGEERRESPERPVPEPTPAYG